MFPPEEEKFSCHCRKIIIIITNRVTSGCRVYIRDLHCLRGLLYKGWPLTKSRHGRARPRCLFPVQWNVCTNVWVQTSKNTLAKVDMDSNGSKILWFSPALQLQRRWRNFEWRSWCKFFSECRMLSWPSSFVLKVKKGLKTTYRPILIKFKLNLY